MAEAGHISRLIQKFDQIFYEIRQPRRYTPVNAAYRCR
ncbi:hypothetical protein [Enterobacter sp.]